MTGKQKRINALVFFDANVSNLEKCRRGCKTDKEILCRHRFRFNVHAIYCGKLVRLLQLLDFQIILFFFFIIRGRPIPNCRYLLLTRDRNFLKDAKKEWRYFKKKAKIKKFYRFGLSSVRRGKYKIEIVYIRCKKHRNKKIRSAKGPEERKEIFFLIDNILMKS